MDQLTKLKKQNRKIKAKLPKEGSNLAELVNLMAEVQLMQTKRMNAENFLLQKYQVDINEDLAFLDETILDLPTLVT